MLKLYNSLTRKIEEFKPISHQKAGIYTCGPTVYNYASIGNFRTYTLSDILVRTLRYMDYEVSYFMNLTDVGHLTGDNEGDPDSGEDKLEKGAKKEGKTAWDIAKFYTDAFIEDFKKLNLTLPDKFPKATDNIPEQIDLIKILESKGLVYKTSDGLYFDTVSFEKHTGRKYGELSDLDVIKEGARVAKHPEKKNPRDFALWKFSGRPGERHMEWQSPWGLGFPGWHIECSAMSMKYLGETIDIHVGGEDLKQTHHANEIAQSEGATDKKFVNFWIHTAFLKVDNKRMGKSLGNAFTIPDIEKRGIDPLALRYLYLTAHYRDSLNFTWQALEASASALKRLQHFILEESPNRQSLSEEKVEKVNFFRDEFMHSISNDLNTPQSLATLWRVVKSNIPFQDKKDLILSFDEVLGLNLANTTSKALPDEIAYLIKKREEMRKKKDFQKADEIRLLLEKKGYTIKDPALNEKN